MQCRIFFQHTASLTHTRTHTYHNALTKEYAGVSLVLSHFSLKIPCQNFSPALLVFARTLRKFSPYVGYTYILALTFYMDQSRHVIMHFRNFRNRTREVKWQGKKVNNKNSFYEEKRGPNIQRLPSSDRVYGHREIYNSNLFYEITILSCRSMWNGICMFLTRICGTIIIMFAFNIKSIEFKYPTHSQEWKRRPPPY